jgi:hypothetical protein
MFIIGDVTMNSEKNDAREQVADIVEQVLAGKLTVQKAREIWPSYSGDDDINRLYGLIDHWNDDDDIRAKDPKYAKLQEEEFRQMVKELRGKD